LLVFRINDTTLNGVIGTGCSLFSQFLHTNKLFVNGLQCAVSGLDKADAVIGITNALLQGGNIGTHKFPNSKTCCVIGRSFNTKP
jgi:hypothetical protein